jgi:hypothetical protein
MTGSGTLLDPYIIYDVNDLQAMEDDLTAYYELGNDIDASATSGWNGGLGFDPIGNYQSGHPELRFSGFFDGKGHIISDLFINRPLERDIGLFGITALNNPGGWIRNVGLVDCDMTGDWEVGALVGFHEWNAQTISYCYSTGIIKSITNGTLVAGFLGYNGSDVEDCYSECDVVVSGPDDTVQDGPFIGLNEWNVSRCHSTGNISISGRNIEDIGAFIGWQYNGKLLQCYSTGNVLINSTGHVYSAGGFTGLDTGSEPTSKCFSTGNVTIVATGEVWGIGGFTGYNNISAFADCYARGNISITTPGDIWDGDIGGMVGYVDHGLEILRSYSTGSITIVGTTFNHVGGFCGNNLGTIINCFWDTQTSGQATSDGGTGKTTAQMKKYKTFTGWGFGTIWGITNACNDGYPCLLDVTASCKWAPYRGNIHVDQLIYQHAERMVR